MTDTDGRKSHTDVEWQESTLAACNRGDTTSLDQAFSNIDDTPSDSFIARLTEWAVSSQQADAVSWVLDRFPDFPQDPAYLYPAFRATLTHKTGQEVYATLVERCPDIDSWDYGHGGNPLGAAADLNDIPYAKYLMGRGAKASEAGIMTFYAIWWLERYPKPSFLERVYSFLGMSHWCHTVDRSAMMKLLKDNGAPTDKSRLPG